MVKCSVLGCENITSLKSPGLSFHRFPKNPELRLKWLHAINRPELKPTKGSVVCSSHSSEREINYTLERLRLKDDALPFRSISDIEEKKLFIDKRERQRELTNARMRKYRKNRKIKQLLLKAENESAAEEIEILKKQEFKKDLSQRQKESSRERSRRYRQQSRSNAVNTNENMICDLQIPGSSHDNRPFATKNQESQNARISTKMDIQLMGNHSGHQNHNDDYLAEFSQGNISPETERNWEDEETTDSETESSAIKQEIKEEICLDIDIEDTKLVRPAINIVTYAEGLTTNSLLRGNTAALSASDTQAAPVGAHDFAGFGQSVAAELNAMPLKDALELRAQIQQLIQRKLSSLLARTGADQPCRSSTALLEPTDDRPEFDVCVKTEPSDDPDSS